MHSVHVCQLCALSCSGDRSYQAHLNGRTHRARVEGRSTVLYCVVCQANIPGTLAWSQHVSGKRHRGQVQKQGISSVVEASAAGPAVLDHMFCTVCKIYVHECAWNGHPISKQHLRRLRFSAIQTAFEEASKDKHGITVSHHPTGLDFGTIAVESAQQGVRGLFVVKNTVPLSEIVLKSVRLSTAAFKRGSLYVLCCFS